MGIVYLVGAIISEVFGSSMLKLTATMKSKLPIVGVIIGYAISFFLLSLALVSIPLSFGYAVWSGVGTALTAIVGFKFFKEKMNMQTVAGILVLVLGIVLMRI
jgi:multidrug transporter EmrE-like cation transporter